MKGVVKLFKVKKAISQIGFLVAGVVMLCYGAMRGEADTVLGVYWNWIKEKRMFQSL